MDPKDTFFKRLQPLEDFAKLFEKSERFGTWNNKTLGIVLVSGKKNYVMRKYDAYALVKCYFFVT